MRNLARYPTKNLGMKGDSGGFTLIEVILVIVVASVLFAMMFAYFSRAVTDAGAPVIRLNQSLDLTQVAERITEHYRQARTEATLAAIHANLSNDPGVYGANATITVPVNQFIEFNGTNDQATAGPEDLLKVMIRHGVTGERLTLVLPAWSP